MGELVEGADLDGAEGGLLVVEAGGDGRDVAVGLVEMGGDELLTEVGASDGDAEDADSADKLNRGCAVNRVGGDGALKGAQQVAGRRGGGGGCWCRRWT